MLTLREQFQLREWAKLLILFLSPFVAFLLPIENTMPVHWFKFFGILVLLAVGVFLLTQPMTFKCTNTACEATLYSNVEWICNAPGICPNKINENVGSFPFLRKCHECHKHPTAFLCYYCGHNIALSRELIRTEYAAKILKPISAKEYGEKVRNPDVRPPKSVFTFEEASEGLGKVSAFHGSKKTETIGQKGVVDAEIELKKSEERRDSITSNTEAGASGPKDKSKIFEKQAREYFSHLMTAEDVKKKMYKEIDADETLDGPERTLRKIAVDKVIDKVLKERH